MSTAPAAAMPVLRKLHGVPTEFGSFDTNGTGVGFASPNTRTPSDVARTNAIVSSIRCASVASSSGGVGPGSSSASIGELHLHVGIVLGRSLGEEVAAHEHNARVGVEADPVPWVLVGAEDQLEVAVGVDLELAVVHVGEHRAVDAPGGVRPVHGERDVDLTVARAGDPIRAVAADQRLVVDGVGVVAEELACRRDDRREAWSLGVTFEEQLGALRQQMEDVPEALDRVELVGLALRGEHVVVADVREEADELVERLGRLWCERHGASTPLVAAGDPVRDRSDAWVGGDRKRHMEELAGRVAVITGAGSGLGAAMADALGTEGMRIVALDIDGGAAAGDRVASRRAAAWRRSAARSTSRRAMRWSAR